MTCSGVRALGSQFQTFPRFGRFVNSKNHLNCLASLAAIDERCPTLRDSLDEIGELAGVSLVRNGGRIARPAGGADFLHEPLADRIIPGLRGLELPAQQVILLDDDAPLITVDADRFRQS